MTHAYPFRKFFPPSSSSPPSVPSPQAQSLATRPKFQPGGPIPRPWLKSWLPRTNPSLASRPKAQPQHLKLLHFSTKQLQWDVDGGFQLRCCNASSSGGNFYPEGTRSHLPTRGHVLTVGLKHEIYVHIYIPASLTVDMKYRQIYFQRSGEGR